MSENKGYAHPEALVDAEWVQAHLHDPTVRLIEVDVDTKAYEQGHIPEAVGLNWQKELQDQVVRAPVGKEQLEELLSNAGVSSDTTIVVYVITITGSRHGHSGFSNTMDTKMCACSMVAV